MLPAPLSPTRPARRLAQPPAPRPALRRGALLASLLLVLLPGAGPRTARGDGDAPPRADPTLALFGPGADPVRVLDLRVAADDVARLREDPRTYVPAGLVEARGPTLEPVGVKLKGAAGSFRDIDDRPCFTLDTDRFGGRARFHGLERLHLNNSVQDPSLLNEALAAEVFAQAGLAAPRVTHARVRLNGRDLGLYVLKEGVDRAFLARHFPDASGNLYDGGFLTDVDGELEKDAGRGPEDRRDLAALVAACRTGDLTQREAALAPLLDLDAFLRFVALELLLGHWDGYTANRNNYRLYHRPPGLQAVFLPHGLDQLFQDPEASVLDEPVGLVAEAVLAVPALRTRYRDTLRRMLARLEAPPGLPERARRLAERLQPAVASLGATAAAPHTEAARDLVERIAARLAWLREHVEQPDPPGLTFDTRGRARLSGWTPRVDEGEPVLEERSHRGRRALAIVCPEGAGGRASWRRRVTLARGRYVLEAPVAVAGVKPLEGQPNPGAGLRLSGRPRARGASGTRAYETLSFPFEVEEELARVELVLELNAAAGAAYFPADAIRLVRSKP